MYYKFIVSLFKIELQVVFFFFFEGILSSISKRPGTISSGGSAGTTTTRRTTPQPRFRDWRRFVWKVSSRQPLDIVLVELSSIPSGVYTSSSLSSFLYIYISLSLNFLPSPRNASFNIHLSFLPLLVFLARWFRRVYT